MNLALTDAKILFGGYNYSGFANQLALDGSAEMLDVTTFGQTTRKHKAGLMDVNFSASGFADFDNVTGIDAILAASLGATEEPLTVAPEGNAEGDVGFAFKMVNGIYRPLQGGVGDMLEFEMEGKARGTRMIRGTFAGVGTKTVTGTGAAQNLGLLATGQKLYAVLHVVAASGTTPTLDVVIESDDAVGFPSAVTRATFAQKTAVGAEWVEVAGPVATDTFWRAKWTIGGTTPSFQVFILFAII